MATPDAWYLALLAICLSLDTFVVWPAFLRRLLVNPGRARVWLWSSWMIELWLLLAGSVLVWQVEHRPWAALRLVLPRGWRVVVTIGLLLALGAVYGRGAAKIARGRRTKRIRIAEPIRRLVPCTRAELMWFLALSVSAGICEEFVFRGYLIWFFQPVLGLWGAAAVSLVIFAAAHAYQGRTGVLAVGVIGALLTLVVLTFGSLVPAMALHVLIDAGQGVLAWLALRDVPNKGQGGGALPASAALPNAG
jgi:hypothetical protein